MYISQTASSYIKHSKQNELKHRATNIPNSDQPPWMFQQVLLCQGFLTGWNIP